MSMSYEYTNTKALVEDPDDPSSFNTPMENVTWWKDTSHPPSPPHSPRAVMQHSANAGQGPTMPTMNLSPMSWATVDVEKLGEDANHVYPIRNIVGGKWHTAANTMKIPHPLDKGKAAIFSIPDTQVDELGPFLESLRKVPKSGMHNPLKNPDRYLKYGEISRKVREDDANLLPGRKLHVVLIHLC